jgi:hypothetical protein
VMGYVRDAGRSGVPHKIRRGQPLTDQPLGLAPAFRPGPPITTHTTTISQVRGATRTCGWKMFQGREARKGPGMLNTTDAQAVCALACAGSCSRSALCPGRRGCPCTIQETSWRCIGQRINLRNSTMARRPFRPDNARASVADMPLALGLLVNRRTTTPLALCRPP